MSRPFVTWPVCRIWALVGLIFLPVAVLMWPGRSVSVRSPNLVAPLPKDHEPAPQRKHVSSYLGPDACIECHADRVIEFQETRHFLANRIPQSYGMPPGFGPGLGTFTLPELSLRFEMTESKRTFIETAIRESTAGKQSASSPIAFCYGAAGGNDEVYFTWRDERLYELPMVWLAPTGEWGASSFDRHGRGDYSRDMTIRCVECHNTWFDYVAGSRNQYGHDHAVIGVTCEVCHGPGKEHVAFHRGNPQVKEPHSVIRPALLSRERQMDLCTQCHSNALKHRGPAFSYRPGEPLDDYYYTLRTNYPEDDHVANQTTYLRQSRCFQASDTMTCVTCHNPHRSRSSSNAGSTSCSKCHVEADCTDRSHLPNGVQDDCIGCHMPERRKIQVFFRTQADRYVAPVKRYEHRIGIYQDAKNEILLNWYRKQTDSESLAEVSRLTALLAETWRLESEKRQSEFRYLAAIDACRESIRFDPNPATREKLNELIAIQTDIDTDLQDAIWHEKERRYEQAIEAFQRVLKRKPNHAMAHGKLGTTYAIVHQTQLAVEHLQAAARFDPDDPYAPAMLGWLAYLDGRAEESLDYYRKADEVEPYSAKIHYQMGLALAKLGRFQQAIECFAKAVEIDPKDANSMVQLNQSLRKAGKPSEAVEPGLQAARITRFLDLEVLLNLAESYAEANRMTEALETAHRALELAQSQQSRLIPKIRDRIDEFQKRPPGLGR